MTTYTTQPEGPHTRLYLAGQPTSLFVSQADAEREGQRLTSGKRVLVIAAPMPIMLRLARLHEAEMLLESDEVPV